MTLDKPSQILLPEVYPFLLKCFGVDKHRGWLEFTKLFVKKGEAIPDMKQFLKKYKGMEDTIYFF